MSKLKSKLTTIATDQNIRRSTRKSDWTPKTLEEPSYYHEVKVELPIELQKNTHQLNSILIYIQDNFKTTNLKEMSNIFDFTVPYLSKIIKLNTGHSFKNSIQTLKLNKAVELLTLSNLKVYSISEAIGYENNTHFIRTFKKVYGVSPNQYRKGNKV